MMRQLFATMLIAVSPPAAAADLGFSLGLHGGLALPALPRGVGDPSLRETFAMAFPLCGQIGLRLGDRIVAGSWIQYAFGIPGETVKDGLDGGSVRDLQLGVQGTYRFTSSAPSRSWASLGLGYEWASASGRVYQVPAVPLGSPPVPATPVDVTETWRGFVLVGQIGIEWAATSRIAVGPFAGLSFGLFDHLTVSNNGATSYEPTRNSLHVWLQGGASVSWDL